jgi:DNA repair exonuclease SbcCD ATPase subunit
MNELMTMLNTSELKNNPEEIAEAIHQLAVDIEECKDNLEGIRDRKIFKRIFNNNTRDLAEAMISQNDTISTFLNIVQALILLNLNNCAILAAVMDKLNSFQDSTSDSGNRYLAMAKDYIRESIEASKTTNKKFDTLQQNIEDTKSMLIEKNKIDERQDKLLKRLSENIAKKEDIDSQQEKNIEEIKRRLEAKELLAKEHDKAVLGLSQKITQKDELDTKQSKEIDEIQQYLVDQQKTDKVQTESIETLQSLINMLTDKVTSLEKCPQRAPSPSFDKGPFIISIIALGISLGSVVLTLLK